MLKRNILTLRNNKDLKRQKEKERT